MINFMASILLAVKYLTNTLFLASASVMCRPPESVRQLASNSNSYINNR